MAKSDKMHVFERSEIEWDIREIEKELSKGVLENPDIRTSKKKMQISLGL